MFDFLGTSLPEGASEDKIRRVHGIFSPFFPEAILLGIGEFSAMLSGAALIGQEAPVDIRVSVSGVLNLCGLIGILCVTLLAAYVFDAWKPGGAFIVAVCQHPSDIWRAAPESTIVIT